MSVPFFFLRKANQPHKLCNATRITRVNKKFPLQSPPRSVENEVRLRRLQRPKSHSAKAQTPCGPTTPSSIYTRATLPARSQQDTTHLLPPPASFPSPPPSPPPPPSHPLAAAATAVAMQSLLLPTAAAAPVAAPRGRRSLPGRLSVRASATAAAAPRRETDPKKRVVITGMGLVSVFGNDVDAYYDRLLAGESGIGPIDRFDASKFPTRFAGQIRGFSSEGYIDGKNDRRLDDCLRYCIVSGKKALEAAGIGLGSKPMEKVASTGNTPRTAFVLNAALLLPSRAVNCLVTL